VPTKDAAASPTPVDGESVFCCASACLQSGLTPYRNLMWHQVPTRCPSGTGATAARARPCEPKMPPLLRRLSMVSQSPVTASVFTCGVGLTVSYPPWWPQVLTRCRSGTGATAVRARPCQPKTPPLPRRQWMVSQSPVFSTACLWSDVDHLIIPSGNDKVSIRDWSYSGEGEAVPAKDAAASPTPVGGESPSACFWWLACR
jgi:hypothetical protein